MDEPRMDAPSMNAPMVNAPVTQTDMPSVPTGAAMWTAAGATVIGASHVRRQQPNQDAIVWSPQAPAASVVMAVSDGHGSAAHFRSEIGARLAVEVAEPILAEAAAEPSWISARDMTHAGQLASRIVATWRQRVAEHLASVPLAPEGNSRHDGDARFLPYGATLVACAATPAGLFLMQLGDGDLVLGGADGAIVRPLPTDEGMVGEQTYSLCLPDAEQHIRLRIVTSDEYAAAFVMLSTDGLSKSFADEPAFLQLAANWRQTIAERGLATVARELDGWLSAASQQGSGDDITLGFIIRSPAASADAYVAPEIAGPPLPSDGRRAAAMAANPAPAASIDAPPEVAPAPAPELTAERPTETAPRRAVARPSPPRGHFGFKLAVAVLLLAAIAAACYYYYAKRVLPVAATPNSLSTGADPTAPSRLAAPAAAPPSVSQPAAPAAPAAPQR